MVIYLSRPKPLSPLLRNFFHFFCPHQSLKRMRFEIFRRKNLWCCADSSNFALPSTVENDEKYEQEKLRRTVECLLSFQTADSQQQSMRKLHPTTARACVSTVPGSWASELSRCWLRMQEVGRWCRRNDSRCLVRVFGCLFPQSPRWSRSGHSSVDLKTVALCSLIARVFR